MIMGKMYTDYPTHVFYKHADTGDVLSDINYSSGMGPVIPREGEFVLLVDKTLYKVKSVRHEIMSDKHTIVVTVL
jgi:hypothetical protein